MRNYSPAVAAHIAARKPLHVHALLWITARDRVTAEKQSIGLWTGADHRDIVVDAQTRTYYGVGAMLGLDFLTARAQLEARSWSVQVSPLHEQVIELIRLYDARLAGVQAHSWFLDPLSHNPLADPEREFRGTVMNISLPTPPVGGFSTCTIGMISDAWRLTRGVKLRRSDAALRARAPADSFRQHNTTPDTVEVAWGETLKTVQSALATQNSVAVIGPNNIHERPD